MWHTECVKSKSPMQLKKHLLVNMENNGKQQRIQNLRLWWTAGLGNLMTCQKDEKQLAANGFPESNTQVMVKLNASREGLLLKVTAKNAALIIMRHSHLLSIFSQYECYRVMPCKRDC